MRDEDDSGAQNQLLIIQSARVLHLSFPPRIVSGGLSWLSAAQLGNNQNIFILFL